MKKSILFSVLVVGATLLQAQSITVHQTCGQNGQVIKAIPDAIDLGLSVKWANMNVGAKYIEDYGNYYAWGETVTKSTYDWSTYFDTNDDGSTFTKYNNNNGGKTVLDPEDDAAHVNWGGSWRMPTVAEWQELSNNCTWTLTTQNGIKGYKVTSNKAGYTDKFIFLPAAGLRSGSGLNGLNGEGSYGYYWSSSLYENTSIAWSLGFDWYRRNLNRSYYRFLGQSVRPVLLPSSTLYNSSSNDTIRIYSNGCDDYQTFIGPHGGQLTMSAHPSDQWSHFVRWNDGNTDNPRTITTNGNADYTAYFETYRYSVRVQSDDAARGSAYISKVVKGDTIEYNDSVGSFEAGSEVFLAYQANYGYHFVQWSDSVTDNPRTIYLTQDTAFTAVFAPNNYIITTASANPEWGTTTGDTIAPFATEVHISAIPNYGYYLERWSDNNVDAVRSIVVSEDKTYTAIFAPRNFRIETKTDSIRGSISSVPRARYLDTVEVNAIPNRCFSFAQWSDNVTDNPRSFIIVKDTTIEAIFNYIQSDKCGKDSALIWTLDTTNLALDITGAGALTDIYTYGYFIKSASLGDDISSIGTDAFAYCDRLKTMIFGTGLKIIEQGAFPSAASIDTITCYSQRPPTVNNGAFVNLAYSTVVYVPFEYLETYKMHDFWGIYDVRPLTNPEGIHNTNVSAPAQKLLRNGQIFILRGEKVYNAQGALVK